MRTSIKINQQKGAVLAVSLIILLVMTIIGLQGISSTTLEERMSRNYRDSQLSFQAAETALRDGEALVESTLYKMSDFSSTCTNGLCLHTATPGTCPATTPALPPWKDTANIWSNSANHIGYSGNIAKVFAQPRFIVEFRCFVQADLSKPPPPATSVPGSNSDWAEMYRITALGFGASDTSRTMLQSTYKKLIK